MSYSKMSQIRLIVSYQVSLIHHTEYIDAKKNKVCKNNDLLQYEKDSGTWTLLNERLTHPDVGMVSMWLPGNIFKSFEKERTQP